MAISAALVVLFVIGPLAIAGRGPSEGARPPRWPAWLAYFGALGAGFMLIEVSILQRFVLLLGHPVYSLTVTLFSLLLGTGLGSAWSRRLEGPSLLRAAAWALALIAVMAMISMVALAPLVAWAVPFARVTRIAIAVMTLLPVGMLLGIPMPAGIALLRRTSPDMLTWAWGMNGALSVVGATLAIFIAMNWGFGATLICAAATYLLALVALLRTNRK